MAELVDALGSGPSGGNTVEVRVLFWAPSLKKVRIAGLFHFQRGNPTAIATSKRWTRQLRAVSNLEWHPGNPLLPRRIL